jgi:hypothetical protein
MLKTLLEKSANPQALERIPRFGEKKPDHSAPAPSRFLAKSPQILGNFQAHPGLRACLRKGRWRRKGNRESNRLWALGRFAYEKGSIFQQQFQSIAARD